MAPSPENKPNSKDKEYSGDYEHIPVDPAAKGIVCEGINLYATPNNKKNTYDNHENIEKWTPHILINSQRLS
jgi:hypothetical protein